MCKLADFQCTNNNNNQTQAAVAGTRNAHKISHNKNLVAVCVFKTRARLSPTDWEFDLKHCPRML